MTQTSNDPNEEVATRIYVEKVMYRLQRVMQREAKELINDVTITIPM